MHGGGGDDCEEMMNMMIVMQTLLCSGKLWSHYRVVLWRQHIDPSGNDWESSQ